VDAVWRAICRVRGSDVVRDLPQLLPLHSVGSARRAQEVESIASYLHKNESAADDDLEECGCNSLNTSLGNAD